MLHPPIAPASESLSPAPRPVCSRLVKEKERSDLWLPFALMGVFALTRWPGLLPPNFSAAYGLLFCAGVFLPRRLSWWLPITVMLLSDILLNCYYQFVLHIDAFNATQLVNYGVYAVVVWLGTRFRPGSSFVGLLGGGILGAVLFYLITNTAAWLFNPFGNLNTPRILRAC